MPVYARWLSAACILWTLLLSRSEARAQDVSIAAASDLKFALDEVIAAFKRVHPEVTVTVTYGSSGKLHTQIRQGAPFDVYFSADIAYPRQLVAAGLGGSEVKLYAIGRLALWSSSLDASRMTLASLSDARIHRIALANPKHAPYGKRAQEALMAAGLWATLEPKLAMGENVAQAVQFVQSGAAQVGIIAAALAVHPQLAKQGGHTLIPAHLHQPLEQGLLVTRRGALRPWPKVFAAYLDAPQSRQTFVKNGFALPDAGAPK